MSDPAQMQSSICGLEDGAPAGTRPRQYPKPAPAAKPFLPWAATAGRRSRRLLSRLDLLGRLDEEPAGKSPGAPRHLAVDQRASVIQGITDRETANGDAQNAQYAVEQQKRVIGFYPPILLIIF